ncbi:Ankyrin repeat-containing protein [Cedratvirus Zaza IHUMI]|uniref:Ankyrin repeat-containing protein n=1 Tax=Cedratvirus Zaza IHUMI TaxID=2126979 RepID=A0A2R8FG04_9VIRU|nr:Ankyrin repeat-containing protein [Cedratvirus Zaza IHUMI]
MFNFLLEIDYLAKQGPKLSTVLAGSAHVEMMRTLVLTKGWVLCKEMFETALEWSCQDMLSCLLELHCPHDQDLLTLLYTAKHDNLSWLIKNLSFPEETLLHVCMHGESENLLVQLIRQGCLPESFRRFYIELRSI